VQKFLIRVGLGLIIAVFGLISYCTNVTENPITGEQQRVQLSPRQEITLGVQARDELAAEYGGLYPNRALQAYIDRVGTEVVRESAASESPYPFEFHLLDDASIVNAFALPGGQIFITTGLLQRLETEAQLAGVLAHEVGHVIARHGAEHLARQQLGAALVNAVGVAASETPEQARQAAVLAQAINQLIGLRYGREDELESDRLGFQFMTNAGYNPQGIVELMQILNSAASGQNPPEFLSTHPNPNNRVERLQELIAERYPQGIPSSLEEGEQDFTQQVDLAPN
jgi:predicted Zn-dependent protease